MTDDPNRPTAITRLDDGFRWPGNRRIAAVFNVAFEGWSDGVAPGVGPMGNPLRPGVLDTNAINWAQYGGQRGIMRLVRDLDRAGVRSSVMINGVMAQRWPDAVRALRDGGHEFVAHSWAMDLLPVGMEEAAERDNIRRTRDALVALGCDCEGWISPRGTPSLATARLLAEEGFVWFGDVFDDDLPYAMQFGDRRLMAIPLTMEVNDLPFVMRFGRSPHELPAVFAALLKRFRTAEPGACYADVTAHTHVFGRPLGAAAFAEMMAVARAADDIWIATRSAVAREVAGHLDKPARGSVASG